ncbi:MAG TPA: hypothetical protein VFZ84_23915 [Burkholderiales bacterium]
MIDWLAALDPRVLIVGVALLGVLLAIPFLLASLRRLRRLRLVAGTLYLLSGAIVLLLVSIAGLVAANLFTYARLTHEQEAARITSRQLGQRHYAVSLQAKDAPPRHFEVRGDEWQIDARVLKWRAMGNLLGLDTLYRLERLSGRYGDGASERAAPRTVHDLAEEPGLDLWALTRRYQRYVPLADALYGSAAFVPMAEGAEYVVTVSSSGLVVRPGNEAARKALGAWK